VADADAGIRRQITSSQPEALASQAVVSFHQDAKRERRLRSFFSCVTHFAVAHLAMRCLTATVVNSRHSSPRTAALHYVVAGSAVLIARLQPISDPLLRSGAAIFDFWHWSVSVV
jgi:hypothetical protein